MAQHPEQREGEVFLTNFPDDVEGWEGYRNIGWRTKRKGGIAYGKNGRIVGGYFPVFIQHQEAESAGVELK